MTHNQYATAQADSQTAFQSAQTAAWAYIVGNWHTPSWKRIPDNHRIAANIPPSVGMYNGNLCTQAGADTMRRAVIWLNRDRKIS